MAFMFFRASIGIDRKLDGWASLIFSNGQRRLAQELIVLTRLGTACETFQWWPYC
jgi:hypothetical protein